MFAPFICFCHNFNRMHRFLARVALNPPSARLRVAHHPVRVLIGDLLEKSQLLFSSSGSRRSTYCFRHTYATFRLMEGVDVYFLAKQMGTSVKMIEDYYGHITPAKNAERILQGVPGWEPIAEPSGDKSGSVNADGAAKGAPRDPPTDNRPPPSK